MVEFEPNIRGRLSRRRTAVVEVVAGSSEEAVWSAWYRLADERKYYRPPTEHIDIWTGKIYPKFRYLGKVKGGHKD